MNLALRILFPPANLFARGEDKSAFTSMNKGRDYQPGDLATEGLKGDSLTQYMRSLTNLTGVEGKQALQSGQSDYRRGVDELEPVLGYLRRLLGGDRSEMEAAIQPAADPIREQFAQIRRMITETGPRGGARASLMSQLPFEETRQISNLINQARSGAASLQANVASGLARLGLGESQLGADLLSDTIRSLLARRGQNIETGAQNKRLAADLANILF